MSNQKTILIIEDEPDLQRTLGEILHKHNIKVIKALDGELGLKLAQKEKPDAILLDLILPKKDGFDVLAELKRNTETKKIPVIILTNLEGIMDVQKALSIGATNYLVKANYDLSEVVNYIKKILNLN